MLTGLLASAPADAATPTLLWRDVTNVGVQCLVQSDRGVDAGLGAELCGRIRTLAGRGAPVSISAIPQGDPALLAAGTVTLLVHAFVRPAGRGRLLAFSVRPFRNSTEQTSVLFAAAPRAAEIPASGTASPALDAALASALAETLPWQAQSPGARPLGRRL